MSDTFNLLGPAEKHIANQIRELIETGRTEATKLADTYAGIDDSGIEDALLDPKRKQTVIDSISHMQKAVSGLSMQGIVPLIVGAIISPTKETA